METISSSIISTSSFLSGKPEPGVRRRHTSLFTGHNLMTCRLVGGPHLPNKAKTSRLRPICAKKGDNGFGLVDEDMIVLRKRIHDMEIAECNYEAPSNWMEWEKRHYTMYGSDVCGFVGLIQSYLLKTRPAVGIGLVVMTAMSVPTSAVFIWLHMAAAVRSGVLGG